MTADERLLVEWVVWNIRTGDLPTPVRQAAHNVRRAGACPRPDDRRRGYGPLTVHVAAFPTDETRPLLDEWCARTGVAATVDALLTAGIDYVLVHQQRK